MSSPENQQTAVDAAASEQGLAPELFRALVENIPELAWTARPDGFVEYYNQRWYDYTGTTLAQMQGWGWQAVHAPDMLDVVLERWRQSLSTGEPFEMEFPLRGRDGRFRWFLTRVRPLRRPDGSIARWVGINTDVDDQRRLLATLSETEARLKEENLINTSLLRLSDAFARELDDERLLQLVTDEATQVIGAQFGAFFFNVEREDGEAYLLYTLAGVPKAAFEKFPMPRATPLFAPTFKGETAIRLDDVRKDPRFGKWGPQPEGHLPVVSYLAVPVVTKAGKVLGGLFFGHREPARFAPHHERLVTGIASHAAVALHNARLYRSLREEQEKVKRAYEVARAADARKDEFLAMLGHELRNPLAPIVTALQVMQLRGDGATQKERSIIERQVNHLVTLVDDLLDVSRITRGKLVLTREDLELGAVLNRAIEVASPLLDQRKQHLLVGQGARGVRIHGDAVRLAQVFSNLLTNASKFTEPGGRIEVLTSVSDGRASVSVVDHGIGIAPELLPRIFEMFVQGDQRLDRADGGLGIGLTLVKSLVNLHGGEVTAHSDGVGRGSRFTVVLPISQGADQAEPRPSAMTPRTMAQSAPDTRRIFVVDDNVDAAESLADALRAVGHEVVVAHDGPSALRLLERFLPEVAILDIGLPVMDGYELAGHLRAAVKNLRLAALTGYGQDSDKEKTRAAGFNAHFVKPVDLSVLERFAAALPAPDANQAAERTEPTR